MGEHHHTAECFEERIICGHADPCIIGRGQEFKTPSSIDIEGIAREGDAVVEKVRRLLQRILAEASALNAAATGFTQHRPERAQNISRAVLEIDATVEDWNARRSLTYEEKS